MPQREVFPLNQPPVIEHNIKLSKEYYTRHQHSYYKNIVITHFTLAQTRDTRFIPSPTLMRHTQISIIECNPEKDITIVKNTIQTPNESTYIYEDTGKHLFTIPTIILKWFWQ